MAYGNEKLDKRWELRSVPVAQPAAGVDWSVTVPAGAVWKVKAVFAKFIASASVGNRFPELAIDDGGTNPLGSLIITTSAIAASGGGVVTAAVGLVGTGAAAGAFAALDGVTAAGSVFTSPLPDLVLAPGWRILSNTFGILAGDQWSNIALLVEQADAN